MDTLGFTCSNVGHTYEISNVEGGSQILQFIRKEADSEGMLKTILNGVCNENVIAVLIDRITYLNNQLPDPHNIEAHQHLEAALLALQTRTAEREAANTEGTNKA